MSEDPLERSQAAIDEAKKAAAAAPVMPFDDATSPEGRTPEPSDEPGSASPEANEPSDDA